MSLVIGVTGPSGCGKSVFTEVFSSHGCPVLDADSIYHALLQSDEALRTSLGDAFGRDILTEDGIDRKALSAVVFKDPTALQRLNAIAHPPVCREILTRIEKGCASCYLIDAPQLFESGLDGKCTITVGILAPRDARIARIKKRDGLSPEDACRRTDAQKPDSYYIERCSCILRNDGTLSQWMDQAQTFYQHIIQP